MKYRRLVLASLIGVIRPLLGHWDVCIYHHSIPCIDYALHAITYQPLYRAIPSICLRVLSCNPITAWWQGYWSHR